MTCLGVVYSALTLKGMFYYLCLKEVIGHWARALHNFFFYPPHLMYNIVCHLNVGLCLKFSWEAQIHIPPRREHGWKLAYLV